MARTVADTALMLTIMAGSDDRSPISYDVDPRELTSSATRASVKGWRIAWSTDLGGLVPVDDESARGLRARRRRVRLAEGACGERVSSRKSSASARLVGGGPSRRQAPGTPRGPARGPGREHRAGPGALSSLDVARGELLRTQQWERVRAFLETRDLLVTPTAATPPFALDQPHVLMVNGQPLGKGMQRSLLTYAVSVMGLPAISIPCGFTRDGLPVGLQIISKRRGEVAVLRAATAFEAAHPRADHRPPVGERALVA
jgi:amidase